MMLFGRMLNVLINVKLFYLTKSVMHAASPKYLKYGKITINTFIIVCLVQRMRRIMILLYLLIITLLVFFFFISAQFVVAVSELNPRKAAGLDYITAEHLKYCSITMISLLCTIFNGFLLHGYLPQNMMSVVVSPILKAKAGNICDTNNTEVFPYQIH